MDAFSKLLHQEIGEAYGLEVEISVPKEKEAEESTKGVRVARWKAKVHVPQVDLSVSQNQIISIEVADVPAHDIDLVAVAANYPHLPAPHRQLIIAAETLREILADKLVALGARPCLKARDIWDIKFLTDRQVIPDIALIARKLEDYGLSPDDFKEKLQAKLTELEGTAAAKAFHQEMSRFVDASVASQLANPALAERFLHRSKQVGLTVLSADLVFKKKS